MSDARPKPLPGRLSGLVLIGTGLASLYLCLLMAAPFLPAIVWAFVLTILAAPLDSALRGRIGSRAVAAAITVVLVTALVVLPALFVAGSLLSEAVRGATLLGSLVDSGAWARVMDMNPLVAAAVRWTNERFDLQNLLQSEVSSLGHWSATVLQGSISGVINLLLTFYFFFYFLRDRERTAEALRETLPLSRSEFSLLAERVVAAIHATVFGTTVVAILQGVLGGLMFWWLELPAPVVWGVLMGLLGIVPFLGAFVIWVPAALYLALSGEIASAVALSLWGTLVVGLADNIVYPVLVGRRLMLPTTVSFVAVVGGVVAFGATGLVLGPIVVTLTLVLLRIWRFRSLAAGTTGDAPVPASVGAPDRRGGEG